MARRVRWTDSSLSDLAETHRFIARDSRFYAATFVREVRDAARSLREFAERGRVVPEIGDPRFRELLVRQYRLIYTLAADDEVVILGFVHGARDLRSLWDL